MKKIMVYCDRVDMTIGYGNWNGCRLVLPGCRRGGCDGAIAANAGRQAGPRRVFSRAIAAIFYNNSVHNTDLTDILSLCHEPTSANAELNVLIY